MKASTAYRIYIVEDDLWYGELLSYHLSMNPDYELHRFSTAKDCLKAIATKPPHLITLDYSLPDANGGELLRRIRTQLPEVPVIVISGQNDVETAVQLLRSGAQEYLVKDDRTRDLLWKAILTIRDRGQAQPVVSLPPAAVPSSPASKAGEQTGQRAVQALIKGSSPALEPVFSMVEKAVRTAINVTITGETGTGKELVSQAIHQLSDRKHKPFVAVNVGAIPRELAESELFGHEKGAFTGAQNRKIGRFEEANGGTLFLDEIAELDLNLQTKLLRVLQERELVRVGGNEKVRLDIRLVTASHKNLLEEVRQGRFREDLYYRLLGLPIALPPLRDRKGDILLLATHFQTEFCRDNNLPVRPLSKAAAQRLQQYRFPGNVRELKALMQLAAVLAEGTEIQADDLLFSPIAPTQEQPASDPRTLRDYTLDIIASHMRQFNNNVGLVASKLDIGRSSIYKLMQQNELTGV
ncbi:sigma-54 dependent transcriptional regulator [Spirosoma luteolum]